MLLTAYDWQTLNLSSKLQLSDEGLIYASTNPRVAVESILAINALT